MIMGVQVKEIKKRFDSRGFLAEIMKEDEYCFIDVKQTTVTETYPGIIKAFHWHRYQTDVWFIAKGIAQVVLFDLRKDSLTYRETQELIVGEDNPRLILIPPRVAHGYKVLGNKPVLLFYHTDKPYNPRNPDEGRISLNDPFIGFQWNLNS